MGCRGTAAKGDLVRLVSSGGVVVDRRQIQLGRGAYLHADERCVEQALKRRAIGRALRITQVDPEEIRRAFGEQVTWTKRPSQA